MKIPVNEVVSVVDTAVGPMTVTQTTYSGYDIDDFMHDCVVGQATQLRMLNLIRRADPRFTENRIPVRVGDEEVGGFSG